MKPRTRFSLALAAATALAGTLLSASPQRPHLLVIMSDDQGYRDAGFQGGTDIPTPHLDRLAAGGVTFTDGYVTYAVCGPSRAGFITGRYPQRFGFGNTPGYRPNNPNEGLPLSETTLAEALRPVGYHSGLVGKWHLGAHEKFHPLNRGFDEFYGHVGGGKRYFPDLLNLKNTKDARDEWGSYHTWITRGFEPVRTERYLTDEFTREALEFLDRRGAEPEKPFFLFLSYNAPHGPLEAPEEEIAKFSHIVNERRRAYAAMISIMDRGIGEVLDRLDALNLANDTLIFFFSDNGGPNPGQVSSNYPLRAGKSSGYEGGIRVPFVARWPGIIPAGQTFSQPVISLDIFATLAALNHLPDHPDRPRDGVNLIPYLRGEKDGPPHARIYLQRGRGHGFSMREGDYKIVQNRDQPVELYHLRQDIGERNNLAASQPERLASLLAAFEEWNATLIPSVLEGMRPEEWGGRRAPATPANP